MHTYFMTEFLLVIPSPSLDRQRYSNSFKRQIVEATLISVSSIAGVALLHRINANLLGKWQSLYCHGEYG